MIFAERFNLRPQDVELLPHAGGAGPRLDPPDTPQVAWGFYCRFLLAKNCFYAFEGLRSNLFLFVAETKSVPNRAPPEAGECEGRPLVVAWYESLGEEADGAADGSVRVRPCEVVLYIYIYIYIYI